MTFAGFPPTIAHSGTSRVTTAPAASTECAPTVTPSSTMAPEPTQTSSPMTMPVLVCGWRKIGRSRSVVPWLKPTYRRVRLHAHAVAEAHLPAHDRVRVDRAVLPGGDVSGHVAVPGDVGAVAQLQPVAVHAGDGGHEAVLADHDVLLGGQLLLQSELLGLLVRGRLTLEPPRTEVVHAPHLGNLPRDLVVA